MLNLSQHLTFENGNIKEKEYSHFPPLMIKEHSFLFPFFYISMFYMFAIILKVCRLDFLTFLYFKHLHSSRSRWRAVSWSCGWRKSSICPGSCAGRTGWSWSTGGWVRTSPPAPGWRESEAGWWGTRGTSGLIAQVGSGSGASRWIQTDWTWGTGCGYPRSMAAEDGERIVMSC